jgi:MFS family permease
MRAALAEESGGRKSGDRSGAVREMLRRPFLRATVFVVGLGFFIQITGINAVVYYSPRIFEAMGFRGSEALLLLPALVQAASLVAVFVSLALVDKVGRRPILLGGIGMMVVANALLIGVFLAGQSFGGALTVLGFLGVLLFTVGFTFGFGALVWVYAGESFPARLRSLGASTMLTSDLIANVVVSAFFLTMLQRLGGAGTFAVFGALAVAAFFFVRRLAPETKGRNLEDIRIFWENGGRWESKELLDANR